MKILVTGGAGFIGSAVVRLAIARGHQVVNVDALTYAACLDNVASVADHQNYAFERVDIRDRAGLDAVFAKHTRDALTVVADQIGGPTPAREIAAACLQIAEQLIADPSKSGTYHFCGAPDVSWADFARAIFDQAGRAVTVTPIPTTDYPTPAKRPLNSRMECGAMEQVFGIPRPDWREGLNMILQELEGTK